MYINTANTYSALVRHVNQLVVKAEADNADENLIVFI